MRTLSRPYYQDGELLWHKENQEVLHVVERWESVEADIFLYRVADPTHTAYRFYRERDLRDVTLQLGVSVRYDKPAKKLDLDAFLKRVDEAEGPPHLRLDEVEQGDEL